MGVTKKAQAADEFRIAQAFIAQATMHRNNAKRDRRRAPVAASEAWRHARQCIDSARYHLAQCGAILGLNPWPR